MTATDSTDSESHSVGSLDPVIARFLRGVGTMFRLHRTCSHTVCRRAKACATRNALCYQAMRADMQPIVLSILAREWRRSAELGEEREVAPANRDGFLRRLAREDEEIGRIKAGAYGGDDALTPYQLWLKYWAEHFPRGAIARAGRRR